MERTGEACAREHLRELHSRGGRVRRGVHAMTARGLRVIERGISFWLREYRRKDLPTYARDRAWRNAMATCEELNADPRSKLGRRCQFQRLQATLRSDVSRAPRRHARAGSLPEWAARSRETMTDRTEFDCAWCGGELRLDGERVYPNRKGEKFCSKYHRTASNRARDWFLKNSTQVLDGPTDK